jgi:serine/threonine protein kinase
MEYASAIIVGEQGRPACTPAAVCAPELMFERFVCPDSRSPPTRASDIWSLACTIYELVFGRRLFDFVLEITLLGMMATFCGEVPQEWKGYWESKTPLRDLCEYEYLSQRYIFSLTLPMQYSHIACSC